MKKKIIITILLAIVLVIIAYLAFRKLLIYINKSQIGSVTMNGQTYKTTGSIPVEDTNSRELLSKLVNLANLGDINTENFKIHVANDGKINISLQAPYDESKKAALNWLNENGYGDIPSNQIIFVEK